MNLMALLPPMQLPPMDAMYSSMQIIMTIRSIGE